MSFRDRLEYLREQIAKGPAGLTVAEWVLAAGVSHDMVEPRYRANISDDNRLALARAAAKVLGCPPEQMDAWLLHGEDVPDLDLVMTPVGGGGLLPPVLYPMLATAFFMGLRKGELFAWRWQDLDLETRRADVVRAAKHGGGVGLPKGGKPRHLRLPLLLVPILRRWRGICPATPEGLVFPISTEKWDRSADRLKRLEQDAAGAGDAARDARKMLRRMATATPTSCRMGRHDDDVHLADLVVLAGCRPSAVGRNWHKARHTFASRYMASGGDLFVLQKILGHATIQMTMIYAHLSPRHLGDEMDRVVYPAEPAPAEVVNLNEERSKRR